jgi:hypothetical protein
MNYLSGETFQRAAVAPKGEAREPHDAPTERIPVNRLTLRYDV